MTWTLLPIAQLVRRHALRRPLVPLEEVAEGSWEITPGEDRIVPAAYFLPGQLARISDWEFAAEHPAREMEGGMRVPHAPTRGYLLKDAWLVDGVAYKGNAATYLWPQTRGLPRLQATEEIRRGALVCTAAGNRYFGQWLMDDCPRHALAAAHEALPITTHQGVSAHAQGYEKWFGFHPHRTRAAFFHELLIFDDVGHNQGKRERFRQLGDRLRERVRTQNHPGVFILRGRAGQRRVLTNELELAHRLKRTRGIAIVDPELQDVPSIVQACVGARVVMGVEGSALVHGLLVMEPGTSLLTLQPPHRFVGILKHLTDRDEQHFAFVVGQRQGPDFVVDIDEVERTLDLLPQ